MPREVRPVIGEGEDSKDNRDGVEKRDLGHCFVMNHYNSSETSIKTGDT